MCLVCEWNELRMEMASVKCMMGVILSLDDAKESIWPSLPFKCGFTKNGSILGREIKPSRDLYTTEIRFLRLKMCGNIQALNQIVVKYIILVAYMKLLECVFIHFHRDIKCRKGVAGWLEKFRWEKLLVIYRSFRIDASELQMNYIENISNVMNVMSNFWLDVESKRLKKHRFNT